MIDFQLAITGPEAALGSVPVAEDANAIDGRFAVEQHSRRRRAIDSIDDLGDVWDTVIQKLTAMAAQSRSVADRSPYELSSIEFNIGIEAGLNIGLVTKGQASVSLTFTRKTDESDAPDGGGHPGQENPHSANQGSAAVVEAHQDGRCPFRSGFA